MILTFRTLPCYSLERNIVKGSILEGSNMWLKETDILVSIEETQSQKLIKESKSALQNLSQDENAIVLSNFVK